MASTVATETVCVEASVRLTRAMSILDKAGMLGPTQTRLLMHVDRRQRGEVAFGGDPEALARRIVYLRGALQ